MGRASWTLTAARTPPDGVEVDTLSENGLQQTLKLIGRLWHFPDESMYVYYTPKFWAPIERTETS